MRLLYVTKHYTEPGIRDYYTSRVYIRVPLNNTMGGGITRHTTVQLTSLLMMLWSIMQQEEHFGHSAMHSVSVYMGLSSAMFPVV
jgi:hypothetical protein